MAKQRLKPLSPPRIAQPSDPGAPPAAFRLTSSEQFLFDLYAQEPIAIGGTEVDLFQRSNKKSKIDPYYNEPIQVVFDGPYRLFAHVEWPEQTPEAGEEGLRYLWPGGIWIPRKTIEQVGALPVHEGDIVHFWEIPFYDEHEATQGIKTKKGGFFFDIIKVNDDGHIHDNAAFVAFRCDLKRRSSAPPEINFDTLKQPNDKC